MYTNKDNCIHMAPIQWGQQNLALMYPGRAAAAATPVGEATRAVIPAAVTSPEGKWELNVESLAKRYAEGISAPKVFGKNVIPATSNPVTPIEAESKLYRFDSRAVTNMFGKQPETPSAVAYKNFQAGLIYNSPQNSNPNKLMNEYIA